MVTQEEFDKTSVTMAVASSSGLIGFCSTILTLVLTLRTPSAVVNEDALLCTMVFLVFAIVFFAAATEFYITTAWKAKTLTEYQRSAFLGSIPYSLGMAFLAVSIGLIFLSFTDFTILAYLSQVLFLSSWVVMWALRIKDKEPNQRARGVLRGLMIFVILVGIILVAVLNMG